MHPVISIPTIFPVACHTDNIGKNSTFVAIEGYCDNGIRYIQKAIENGASTIVMRHDTVLDTSLYNYMVTHEVTIHRVENPRKELALLSAQAADYPAKNLKIIGITGTKGKTTTAFLLEHILNKAGYKTALISSAQNRINEVNFSASLIPPQPDYLHQFLKVCMKNNIDYVIMEVAAQALTLHRVEGIVFSGIIFTNFSHEHLEFYSNLEEYFVAKTQIFNQAQPYSPILINYDNKWCARLCDNNQSVFPYSLIKTLSAGFYGSYDSSKLDTIALTTHYLHNKLNLVCPTLFGFYNAYNILAATSMALSLNIPISTIENAIQSFEGVPGRLQKHILSNGAQCFIDYAHNPDSFVAVLTTLRALTPYLIVLFGAGGGRDKTKRPIMGAIATQIADRVIITSDNPRLEDPQIIAEDIKAGIALEMSHKVIIELDRKKAIEIAYQYSNTESIIALLGKGPHEYQIIGTCKEYFSERSIVENL